MRYEVDYYNANFAVRTKIVEASDEKLLPFVLKKQDKRFEMIKKVKPLDIPQGGEADGATGK